MRQTIDLGIDLGTTNSGIAVLRGTETEILKNNGDDEITPSVVWLDKKSHVHVGRRAKDHLVDDPENAEAEFKLQMGSDTTYKFKRGTRPLKPEDLSAEVLKSLKADVKQRLGEDLDAAVITVPAAFDLAQSAATRRAADLAGIDQSPLLQEPVAAALAYGFQEESTRAFWLVYDLGGGTFDAALIQVKDGGIQVVNHGGDNHLGGKLIDWKIIDDVVVPSLTQQYSLTDFQRGNPKWRSAFAKLKSQFEDAKIALSKDQSFDAFIEFLCNDDDGKPVSLDLDLRRSEVERLAEPLILRSINICKQVLAERNLKAKDIEKVLLVGGPTKMPILRQMVGDASAGLGIPLEFRKDPITVVARGAAIFGGSQRRTQERTSGPGAKIGAGIVNVQLEYKSVGGDLEFDVDGKVHAAPGQRLDGYTIEFVRKSKKEWLSGKIALAADGVFTTATLQAERGVQNAYEIHLLDAKANRLTTVPDYLTYTVGAAFAGAPLTHSLGIGQADNNTDFVIRKGTALPTKAKTRHRSTVVIRRGGVFLIPLVEGESEIADGNSLIGAIEVKATKRDMPEGTEVEITIAIDDSRLVKARAYVPMLDEEFDFKLALENQIKTPEILRGEAQSQMRRLDTIRKQVSAASTSSIRKELDLLRDEGLDGQIHQDVEAAAGDRDAAQRCQEMLARLRDILNRAEQSLGPSRGRDSLERILKWGHDLIEKQGTPEQRRQFDTLRAECQRAIDSGDLPVMLRKKEDLLDLVVPILHEDPEYWVDYLRYLTDKRDEMTDPKLADTYIAQGLRAVNANDLEQLKSACRQLIGLLPREKQEEARGYGATVPART